MNIALVLAGGCGERTGNDVPKQFLTVNDKPIIVYTMENLQLSKVIDEIYVVCSNAWADFVSSYAKQYNISYFRGSIPSGETRFESMKNGLTFLYKNKSPNDIVCLFDANRPMVPHSIINNTIKALNNADGAIAIEPCFDSMFISYEQNCISDVLDRKIIFKGQNPETFLLKTAYDICIHSDISLNKFSLTEILIKMGKKVNYSMGSIKSMKITTADDFAFFKAILSNK